MSLPSQVHWYLPAWAKHLWEAHARDLFSTAEARMALAIELSARNVEEGTGGPFGAAVFERDGGRLVAVGVNLVVQSGCSHAHAEMTALALAQAVCGHYDLGAAGLAAHELTTSCEPCAMCLGATVWSGVRRLTCGAESRDAEAVGFDEGPRRDDWAGALAARGIEVVTRVRRDEARAVLQRYHDHGGELYNARGQ